MRFDLFKKLLVTAALLAAVCLLLAGCGNKCTVTFDTGGGTEIAAQKVKKGDRIEEPQAPEKAGYTFAGWTYQNEKWSFVGFVVSENMTLTAQWQANDYTVFYTLNGGTNARSNPTTFTIESDSITLAAPSRTGYAFIGWTWEGQTEPQMTVTIPAGTYENKTFTAHWAFDGFDISEEGVLTLKADARRYLPADLVVPAVVNGIAVTSIGEEAFNDCTGLTSITIPDGVTSIGIEAFWGCRGLTSVTIGNGVTSIGQGVFSGCSSLESITIPFVGQNKNGTGSTRFDYIFGYSLPASLQTVVVTGGTSIGESAFYNCTGLTSVAIPDSVTSIGDRAFNGCTGLTSVTIPGSVTSIGYDAFSGCTGLTGVYITDLAKWCGISFGSSNANPLYAHDLYVNGALVTDLTIPDSVTSIGVSAFQNCTGLTSITIPNSVTSIGDWAFSGCTGLTSITIPDGVTNIGEGAFWGCTGLTSVTIPNSVTSIGEYAFYNCTSLTSVTIPNSVTSIAQSAFSGCTGLTSVTIGNGVTSIGEEGFYNCTSLTSVTIGSGVTSIGDGAFGSCTGLTSITIPDGVTSIAQSAFSGCAGLTSVNFTGTKAQWNAISKGSYWNSSTGNYTIHCSDGDIAK